jgi:hypothetical protein
MHDRPDSPAGPTAADRAAFLKPSAGEVQKVLEVHTKDRLDSCLESAGENLIATAGIVAEMGRLADKEITVKGETHTVRAARIIGGELTEQIQHDEERQLFHHQRTPRFWVVLANIMMVLDLFAVVVIFADLFNVDVSHLASSPAATLAAVFLPVILVLVQLRLTIITGNRLNRYRELEVGEPTRADEAMQKAKAWACLTGVVALALTALLVVRLVYIAADVGLDIVWRIVLTGLALAIGLGAPLVKTYTVAEDGTTVSRRRDAFEAALQRERELVRALVEDGTGHLDDATRAHDDYRERLRPDVLTAARAALAEAENAYRLLVTMFGVESDDPSAPNPDPPYDPRAEHAFPPLRWSFIGAPDIDNEILNSRDRTYHEQAARKAELRGWLRGDWRQQGQIPPGPPEPGAAPPPASPSGGSPVPLPGAAGAA